MAAKAEADEAIPAPAGKLLVEFDPRPQAQSGGGAHQVEMLRDALDVPPATPCARQ